jgi:hypothetical protein
MASFDFGSISAYKFGAVGLVAANTNSVAIDTKGFEGVAVVATASTGSLSATNNFTLNFLESDDTNISNATAVARKGEAKLTATNSAVWASVTPSKRYVFAQLIRGGTASANVAMIASLGYPHNAPTK